MNSAKVKLAKRDRRRAKIRAKIHGSAERPRLSIFRSNRGMFAQLIDDQAHQTLVSAHSREIKDVTGKVSVSGALGKVLAEKAKAKNITKAVFDRGGFKYHGRVQALADGAREGGLDF
ncbi:MAG: 50S ribosomal protein L18 [Candidatus Falkowbacteria bacterium]